MAAKFCSSCGAQLAPATRFCAQCGATVPNAEQEVVAVTSSSPTITQEASTVTEQDKPRLSQRASTDIDKSEDNKSKLMTWAIVAGLVLLVGWGLADYMRYDPLWKKTYHEVKSLNGLDCWTGKALTRHAIANHLPLQEGLPYAEARKEILKQGWLPIPFTRLTSFGNIQCEWRDPQLPWIETELKYEEASDCAKSGDASCTMQFIKNGELLVVYTKGQKPPLHQANYLAEASRVKSYIAAIAAENSQKAKIKAEKEKAEQRQIAAANAKKAREERALNPQCKSRRGLAANICVDNILNGGKGASAYSGCMDAIEIAKQACGYEINLNELLEEWKRDQTR